MTKLIIPAKKWRAAQARDIARRAEAGRLFLIHYPNGS